MESYLKEKDCKELDLPEQFAVEVSMKLKGKKYFVFNYSFLVLDDASISL